jgi:hypothetical protein
LVWAVTDVDACGLSDFDSAEVAPAFLLSVPLLSVSDADGGDVEDGPFVDGESFVAPEPADASDEPASDDESEPSVSAAAMPGLLAMAAPMPRATANPPTRPMNLADDVRRVPFAGGGLLESSPGIDIEAHLP